MYCEYCECEYDEDFVPDAAEHQDIHARFKRYEEQHGRLPHHYRVREANKEAAHAVFAMDGLSDEVYRAAGLLLMQAWFDRSVMAAIDMGREQSHPDFEEYVMSAAYPAPMHGAQQRRFLRVIPEYGIHPSPHMKPGSSYWD